MTDTDVAITPPPGLRLSEAIAFVAVLGVAALSWAALALAHVGAFSGLGASVVALVVLVGAALVVLRRGVRPDPGGIAAFGVLGVLVALLFLPGWRYTVGDKDPGAYVSHAVSIARTGDAVIADPLRERVERVALNAPGVRLPGVLVRASDGATIAQFFHLWPALLAVAFEGFGPKGIANTAPLLGVLSVLTWTLAVRRAVGPLAAGLTAVLLATNMLEVWQAKYPTTEMLAQLLLGGALLALVLAVELRWKAAAGAAGALVGLSWLARPDGLLLVGVAALVGAGIWATKRWDQRCTSFAIGLLVVVPHGAWQAWWFARDYNLVNGMPRGQSVVLATAALAAAAAAARLVVQQRGAPGLTRRAQLRVGWAVVAAVGIALVLGVLRPRLFGESFQSYHGPTVRSYDEQSLRRLSWFLTLPSMGLLLVGLGVVALRRWCASIWLLLLPGLLLAPIYLYSARNSSRLMWWGRRFIPAVLPVVLVLIAIALAYGLRHRLLRPIAAGMTVYLAGTYLTHSVPLRAHEEYAGADAVVREVATAAAGGVVLWEPDRCCESATRLFALPVWLAGGVVGGPLPTAPRFRPSYIDTVGAAFPDRLFVAWSGVERPAALGAVTLAPVLRVRTRLPMWRESDVARPDGARWVPVDFTLWRVQQTARTAATVRSMSASRRPFPEGSTSPLAATSRQPGKASCTGSMECSGV